MTYLIVFSLSSENGRVSDQRQLAYRLGRVVCNYFMEMENWFFEDDVATEYL